MTIFTLAICDDEHFFLERLSGSVQQYLAQRGLKASIACYSSGEELLGAGQNFDIVLIDIKMPGISGIETVRRLQAENKISQIVFITSYPEYAVQAFDVDAVHYLLKPVSPEKFHHALDKAIQAITTNDSGTLAISKGGCTQRIVLGDIIYCEAIDHRIYIHTRAANLHYFGTLDSLQQKLDNRFFRCHRSYIVNLYFVISKQSDLATMAGGGTVLVSRRKQQEFSQRLLAFYRKELL